MPHPLREDFIEFVARAFAKHNNKDPDYVPSSKYCWIDGKPEPNWKHYRKWGEIAVDAIFLPKPQS